MLQLCYSYVTAINRPFSIWALFFVFTSSLFTVACSEEPQAPDLKLDAPSKSAEIRDRAAQAWDSIRMEHADLFIEKDGHVLLRNEFTESNQATDDICQCGVEVISVSWGNPSGYPGSVVEFWSAHVPSGALCPSSPSMPGGCPYFSILYAIGGIESCVTILDPNCVELITSPPLTGAWHFNCDLPAFSTVPVSLGGFSQDINNCLAVAPLEDASITFKIHCVGKDYSDRACTQYTGAVTIYSSDEITLTIPSGHYVSNPPVLFISLSGCGCQPDYFALF